MAHMIMENDNVMVTGRQSWHGLSIVVDNAQSSWDALRIAGLDWDVVPTDVFANGKAIPGYQANVRSDTQEVLGVVTKRYRISQNRDSFLFVDEILKNDSDVKFHSAGSLENGRRVFMMAEMPAGMLLGNHVSNFLFFTNSHNGKSAIQVGLTNTVIECNNTLNLAIKESPRTWTTKHIGDLQAKQMEAIHTLRLASSYILGTEKKAEEMYAKKLSHTQMGLFLDMLFPVEDDMSERTERNILSCKNKVWDIYNDKDDLQNFHGTAWGAYNAVSDFVSNSKPVRLTKTYKEKLFASFLDGNVVLQKAQELLQVA